MPNLIAGTLLCFDFGERRIGVAMGESSLGIAHPLETILAISNEDKFKLITPLIDTWKPTTLVVGFPTHADGNHHAMSLAALRFARRLRSKYELPVMMVDERYSSEIASEMLREAGVKGRKQKTSIDQVAACAILSSYFEGVGISLEDLRASIEQSKQES